MSVFRKIKLLNSLLLLFIIANSIIAQSYSESLVDSIVNKALKEFDIPGIAVAIIKDNKIIHSKGYGVRSLSTKLPVDENTLFGIASNSKAFTSATLGILVDKGKLNWDDKVIDFIPEFRLYDPYVTNDFTIRDLLTHRSGMGLGAGDLMFFPDSTNFTLKELIHNLRYLKQTSPFRSKFDYDNLLYMVAGEIVKRVSGLSWESFVEEKIMEPLGMNNSAASFRRLKDQANVIDGHAPVEGKVKVVNRHMDIEGENPAGGIYSSIADLSNWVLMHLNNGKFGIDLQNQLLSEKVHNEIWSPQTILPLNRKVDKYNSHFRSYGLGWFLIDVNGYKEVAHTGSLEGMVTQVTMYPELNLGIIVLTNQQAGGAMIAITNTIKDIYFGMELTDWINIYKEKSEKGNEGSKKITDEIWAEINKNNAAKTPVELNKFIGRYKDDWFGEVEISEKKNKLFFNSMRSPKLNGEMFFYKGNTFVVKWTIRSFDADSFVKFNLDFERNPESIEMKAISPFTDFSYDFHDLDLRRIKD
ncbi:MAG: serine hydrolase [Ignavibacteriales bacterium]|nr:serine hydrolase [Ignavibacteriales bacterium]